MDLHTKIQDSVPFQPDRDIYQRSHYSSTTELFILHQGLICLKTHSSIFCHVKIRLKRICD